MPKKLLAILLLLFISTIGCTQNFDKAKLDDFLDKVAANNQNMGSLAILHDGAIVYEKAIGYSQINNGIKTPATSKTKYRIGSISKVFTGVMIFQLIEEGKLALETPLATWYPQLPNAAKITIGQMLSHRSGLHNMTEEATYASYHTTPQTQAEMVAMFEKMKPDFEPGAMFHYSNTNFVLLGYIIEKITKQSYAEELKVRITSKIGLTDTYYGVKTNPANNEAYSYSFAGDWKQTPETDMSIPGGAGAVVSTSADLTKFIAALFGGKLISTASLAHMKDIKEGYGMAMTTTPFYDKNGYGHNGAIDSFLSTLIYFPEDKVAVAYISNGTVYSNNSIMIGVLSAYFNKPFTIPDFTAPKTIALTTEELDRYLGQYSSTQVPLKITVTKDKNTLVAQAAGQSAFSLSAVEKNKFVNAQYGITLLFDADKPEFTLLQGAGKLLFTKTK